MTSDSASESRFDRWPDADLETVNACPVCGGEERLLMHEALTDGAFGAAPGRWPMWRCNRCGAGHLSPRPTRQSIMRAYSNYYTHTQTNAAARPTGWRGRLENGYINMRFGTQHAQASQLGPWVFKLLPIRRSAIDRLHRHLPRRTAQAHLLDVGCGDGAFLAIARDCGWLSSGVEPDPVAAEQARRRGFEVRSGGIETLDGESGLFDAITLSHALEHMHDPLQALCDCHRLLCPGGWLWIETPNLDSEGHRLFGSHWRGLEAPRHLVMFNRASLEHALKAAGFGAIQSEPVPSSRQALFSQSEAIRLGMSPGAAPATLPPGLKRLSRRGHLTERWLGAPREFLTVSARRPA